MAIVREYDRQIGTPSADFGRRANAQDMGFAQGISDLAHGIGDASMILKRHEEDREISDAQLRVANLENELDTRQKEIQSTAQPGIATADQVRTDTTEAYTSLSGQYKTPKAQQYVKLHGANATGNRVKASRAFDMDLYVHDQSAKREALFDDSAKSAYADPSLFERSAERLTFDYKNKMGVFSTSGDPRVDLAMGERFKIGMTKMAWSAAVGSVDKDPVIRGQVASMAPSGASALIASVMKTEGGFVANDNNKGATNRGINGLANGLTEEQTKNLTKEGAEAIYKKNYWDKFGIEQLNPTVQAVVFDGVVNHRVDFAKQLVEAAKGGATAAQLGQMRKDEYNRLAENPDNQKYLKSWMGRVDKTVGEVAPVADYAPPKELTGAPWWPHLTVDQQHNLTKQAQERQRKENVIADHALKQTIEDQKSEFASLGKVSSNELPATAFRDAVQYADYKNFYQTSKTVEAVIDQPVSTQQLMVESMKPQQGLEPGLYRLQNDRYQQAVNMINSANNKREEDQVGVAIIRGFSAQNPIVPIQDFSADKIAEAMAVRYPQSEAVREAGSLRTHKPLGNNEAANLAQYFKQLPPDQKSDYISKLAKAGTAQQFNDLAEQVWKDENAVLGVAKLAVIPESRSQNGSTPQRTSQMMMAGYEILSLKEKGDGAKDNKGFSGILPNAESIRVAVGTHLAGQKLSEDVVRRMSDAVRAHYVGSMVSGGVSGSLEITGDKATKENKAALVNSIKTVIGEPASVGSSKVLKPWGMSNVEFTELVKAEGEKQGYGSKYYGLQPIDGANQKYAILVDGMVQYRDGKVVEIDMNEAKKTIASKESYNREMKRNEEFSKEMRTQRQASERLAVDVMKPSPVTSQDIYAPVYSALGINK
jgi:hypothetical protein